MKYKNIFLFGSTILLTAAMAFGGQTNVSAVPAIYNPENPTEPITPQDPDSVKESTSDSSTEQTSNSTEETTASSSQQVAESHEEAPKKNVKLQIPNKPKKRYIQQDFFLTSVPASNEIAQTGSGSGNDSFANSQAAHTAYLLSGIVLFGRKAI